MATTIVGGATKRADGTWQDANGEPLNKERQAQAEKLHAEVSAQRADAEAALIEQEARMNPLANALVTAMNKPPAVKK